MSTDEVYQAAKKVFASYGAFFDLVAQELGLERALALHVQAHEKMGVAGGALLAGSLGRSLDLTRLRDVLQQSNRGIGIECELHESTDVSVVFANRRCPMFDGYRMGGLNDHAAETLCQRGAPAKLGSMLRELNPRLEYSLKRYRAQPADPCLEEIRLPQA